MKTVTIILSYLFLLSSQLLAENEFFNNLELTRISSNFSGSASNGNAIVVYGDGGIIIRSTNGGEKWEKIILPDSLGIVGMTNIGSKFFGLCTQRYGITSDDNGLTWNFIDYGDKAQFFQLIRANNRNYALLNYKVWIFDDNLSKIKEYSFTSDTTYFNFTVAGNQIIISSGKGMLTFINTDNDQSSTRPLSDFGGCTDCPLVSNLKTNGTNLILFSLTSRLIKLNLSNNSLDTLCFLIKPKGGVYDFINSDLVYLYSRKILSQLDSLFLQQIDLNTGKFTRLNVSEKDRYINGLYFQSLNQISKDTLIAVGKNNLIYMSYDAGIHWEIKSYLGNIFKIYQFDKSNFRAIGPNGQFFHSNDGCVTWLPPVDYYQEFYDNYGYNDPMTSNGTFSFKDQDNGFIYYSAESKGDKSCAYTQDGGDNLYLKSDYGFYQRFNSYSLEHNGKYLFFQWGGYGWDLGNWTVMFQLDDTLGIEKKTSMRGMQMFFADKNKNGFYGIGKDTSLPDNTYTVLYSNDGLNWNKDFTFQIETPLIVNSDNAILIDDYIYASWTSKEVQPNDSFLVQNNYRIDLRNKTSKKVLDIKADGQWKMSKIKDDYFITLYSYDPKYGQPIVKMLNTNNIEASDIVWKEVDFRRFGVPNLVNSLNDSNLIFTTYDTLFRTNAIYMGKINKPTDVDVMVEAIGQLYLSNPMPQPADNYVKLKIYWDQRLSIDDAKIIIFDLNGEIVSSDLDLSINKINNYSGEIYCKSSQLQAGIYILIVSVKDIKASSLIVIE